MFFAGFQRVGSSHFVRMLGALGYELGPREDAGLIHASHATRGPYQVTLDHEAFAVELLSSDPELEVTGITVSTAAGQIPWRELPQPFFSELALDVHRLMGPPKNPALGEERCRVVAAEKSEREAATLEVLWHEELGGQLHFVGRFSDGVYCVSTLVQGNATWFEGDRDGTLACLPPELFELALPGVAPTSR